MSKQLADVECIWLHETRSAVLIKDDKDAEIWLPLSLVEIDHKGNPPDKRGHLCEITLPQRLAEEKGLV